jgi:hypothetical protein
MGGADVRPYQEKTHVSEDIRTTQEIFGDLFGGLATLGARGVDGLVIAKALARLLIQQGIISRDIFIETMREVAKEELEESEDISTFLSTTYTEILDQLQVRAQKKTNDDHQA